MINAKQFHKLRTTKTKKRFIYLLKRSYSRDVILRSKNNSYMFEEILWFESCWLYQNRKPIDLKKSCHLILKKNVSNNDKRFYLATWISGTFWTRIGYIGEKIQHLRFMWNQIIPSFYGSSICTMSPLRENGDSIEPCGFRLSWKNHLNFFLNGVLNLKTGHEPRFIVPAL